MGAIGGLAEQPLQSLHNSHSLFTGVGKGLIGLVTKPVGAVAELVNQTGQGLLRITGANRAPTSQLRLQRFPLNKHFSRFSISPTKCLFKFIHTNDSTAPGPQLNAIIEAVYTADEYEPPEESSPATTQPYNLTGCYLALTEDVLYIIDKNDDMLLRAFYLAQIDLATEPGNASLLVVTLHSQKVEKFTNEYEKIYQSTMDRLVEYIKVHSVKSNESSANNFFLDTTTTTTSAISCYFQFSKLDILSYLDYYNGLPCSCGAVLTSLRLAKPRIDAPTQAAVTLPLLIERLSIDLCEGEEGVGVGCSLPKIHRIQSIDKFELKTTMASDNFEAAGEARNLNECHVRTKQQRQRFHYYVDPRMSAGFVSVFNCLKRKLVNKGFQY